MGLTCSNKVAAKETLLGDTGKRLALGRLRGA